MIDIVIGFVVESVNRLWKLWLVDAKSRTLIKWHEYDNE